MSVLTDSTSEANMVYKKRVKKLGSLLTNALERTGTDKAWPLKQLRKMIIRRKTMTRQRIPQDDTSESDVSESDIPYDVPVSDVTIDLTHLKGDDLKRTVLSLIHAQLPDWKDVTLPYLTLERVSGALTNAVFYVTATTPPERKVLLRIYGVGVEQLFQRERELHWLRLLSQLNIGAQLRGVFANGRFEQYLDSATLTKEDIRDPATSVHIAQRLYELHNIVDTFPPSAEEKSRPEVWTNIGKWYPLAVESAQELARKDETKRTVLEKLDVEKLWGEIEEMKRVLAGVWSPIVFGHNDAQYGNILRLKDHTHELVVVDFEYAGYNYRGFDISNHFCEWMADYHSSTPAELHPDRYPTRNEQMRFLNAYLDAQDAKHGQLNDPDRKSALESLRRECEAWAMASHALWGLWGLIQASQSEIEFDYLRYGVQRIEMFRKGLEACKQRI
ncbi:kinase-like domain-containing protein [Jimgerdemannia flammicorona]|uniref:Kinase-like domain-containing protein n=1 Tax=Jimgerdemannia flammicorona TaxID=994334 RepID=A0A433QP64_9FUNG|nr:kinase-like domain-containing protein [Jimgerdemannia flammicorona]